MVHYVITATPMIKQSGKVGCLMGCTHSFGKKIQFQGFTITEAMNKMLNSKEFQELMETIKEKNEEFEDLPDGRDEMGFECTAYIRTEVVEKSSKVI